MEQDLGAAVERIEKLRAALHQRSDEHSLADTAVRGFTLDAAPDCATDNLKVQERIEHLTSSALSLYHVDLFHGVLARCTLFKCGVIWRAGF